MTDSAMDGFLAVTKALADSSRVRILALLLERPLCVCQITEVLGLAPSTVSKHLFLLRRAGLLSTEKEGRWIHCRATPRARRWAVPRTPADLRRLQAVLRIDPAVLCRRRR